MSPKSHAQISLLVTLPALLGVVDVAGPEREVIAQELHDEGGILVRLLAEGVQLGDGVVERLLREGARLRGLVLNLEVEHGVVERQAEADGVRRGQARVGRRVVAGDFGSFGVGVICLARHLGAILLLQELREVAVVVALHLEVEHLALVRRGVHDEVVVQDG